MPFFVSASTLESLEWPILANRLAGHLRTAQAKRGLEEPDAVGEVLFEANAASVRERLAQTSEARSLLDAGQDAPLGDGSDLSGPLSLLRRGGVLTPRDLVNLQSVLAAVREAAAFLRRHAEAAPRLTDLVQGMPDLADLEEEIAFCIDPGAEVRDDASETLREVRREARALSSELTSRIEQLLHHPDVAGALSDSFYTLRNNRFVLPVRADARRRVPGIVHDASASGTTVFVEPEQMVEQNNRLKQAELAAQREVRRILRSLSSRAAASLVELEAALEAMAEVDHAFARGHLSLEMDASEPVVGADGIFRLPLLRHPLIPTDEVVPNDVHLGDPFSVLVISGPNAGGKTVVLKAVALCALMVRAGLHVPAAPGSRVDLMDAVLADIGDAQDLSAHLSTFSAHVSNLAAIVRDASRSALVVLDEIGVGTDPSEGAALGQAVLEALADSGASVIATTHFNLLKEIAVVDARFENGSMEFDPDTLEPTYRLRFGAPGISSATVLAARMGLQETVVARARALIEGEDAQLQGLLSELSRNRIELDRERDQARRLREEGERLREEYQNNLSQLRGQGKTLLRRLRGELDDAFREAKATVAGVIRDLQRGGTARDAAHARNRLAAIETQIEERVQSLGLGEAAPLERRSFDWDRSQPGDPIRVGERPGTLVSMPDRRGRVVVQLGSARITMDADRVEPHTAQTSPSEARREAVPPAWTPREDNEAAWSASGECDLRGLRVDEAVESVDTALDRAMASGRHQVLLIHGHGSGVLREAVRAHLSRTPHVREYRPGEESEGGNGVTVALLS